MIQNFDCNLSSTQKMLPNKIHHCIFFIKIVLKCFSKTNCMYINSGGNVNLNLNFYIYFSELLIIFKHLNQAGLVLSEFQNPSSLGLRL